MRSGGLRVTAAASVETHVSSLQLVELSCPKCGGNLRYVPGMAFANCPFCQASVALVQAGRVGALEDTAYRMARFRVTEAEFRDRLLSYLAEGDYTPADVLEAAQVQTHTGLFAPVYLYEGRWMARFSASCGFEHNETYVDEERVQDAGGRTRTRPVTRTRTVTDWRPLSGEASGAYRLTALSSKQVPAEVASLCENIDGLELVHVEMSSLQGYALEAYASEPAEAFRARGTAALDALVEPEVKRRLQGDRQKDLRYDTERREETVLRLYRPVWLALYAYGGQTYVFASDGVTDRTAGTRPEDTALRKEAESLQGTTKILWVVGILLCWTLIAPIAAYLYYQREVAPKMTAHDRRVREARATRESARARARGGAPGPVVRGASTTATPPAGRPPAAAPASPSVPPPLPVAAPRPPPVPPSVPPPLPSVVASICARCEAELSPGASFCKRCGARLG